MTACICLLARQPMALSHAEAAISHHRALAMPLTYKGCSTGHSVLLCCSVCSSGIECCYPACIATISMCIKLHAMSLPRKPCCMQHLCLITYLLVTHTWCMLQQTPPRRIYRRIKRDSRTSNKSSNPTSAAATAPPAGRATNSQPTLQPPSPQPVLNFDVGEARKAAARWGHMGPPPNSGPLMIWPLHSGNQKLQSHIIRVEKEHIFPEERGQEAEEPTLVEESSSGSRVNSKKRSAPTTLVNTPQMLQQLAKEGSSRDSTCSSNSDETGSQDSDDSDDSEPDVVSRQQHPFGMQNGIQGGISSQPRAVAPGAGQGNPGTSPVPAVSVRSISPVPVGVMTATQLRQRRQQESAMPSTGYHVPGGVPVAHKASLSGGHSAPADTVPLLMQQALLSKQMLDMVDGFGRAPLHVAAAAGRVDVVQQLLFGGCDYSKALQADFRCVQYPLVLLFSPVTCKCSDNIWLLWPVNALSSPSAVSGLQEVFKHYAMSVTSLRSQIGGGCVTCMSL